MKPPINDPNRNEPDRNTSGATGTPSTQTSPGAPAKVEPAKPVDPIVTSAKPPVPPGPGTPGAATPQPQKPDALRTGFATAERPKSEPVRDTLSAPKTAAPAATPAKPDLAKPDLAKPDLAKPDLAKADPTKPDLMRTEAAKSDGPRLDPAKPDVPKPEIPKSEPAKVGAPDPIRSPGTVSARADAPKPDALKSADTLKSPDTAKSADATKGDNTVKSDAPKTEAPKASGFTTGARAPSAPSDGPIIDLKARRIPDPAETARREAAEKGSPTASATGPKSPPASSTDPKARPSDHLAAAPQSKGSGPGFGSVAAAGLLGGVLGAGLLFAVERAGVIPSQSDDLANRLTALDRTVGTLAPRDALASLDTRIAGNEAALKPLPEAVRKAEAAAREALEKAGVAPVAAPDGAAPAAPATLPADIATRLDALDQRVAALQEEPGRDQAVNARAPLSQGDVPADQIAKLDGRLSALEGKSEGAPKPADAPDPNAGLGARLTSLQGEVESRTKANTEAEQALTQKLAALQANLDERVKAATEAVQTATEASRQSVEANKTQAEEAAKAVARQIQAQTDRIAGLDKAVSERAETATVQAALRVVSADRIATALSTGSAYSDALTSLRNLEPGDPARLNAAAVFADKGAPTASSLAAEFRPIAERIAASRKSAQARTVAESGDITQRFMSMADSIIQVRKVDAPTAQKAQGADPVTEVQAALDRGAIGEASKAFAALPDATRAEAGEFGTRLASRAAAGEAAQGLLADAFKGLSASAAARPAPSR